MVPTYSYMVGECWVSVLFQLDPGSGSKGYFTILDPDLGSGNIFLELVSKAYKHNMVAMKVKFTNHCSFFKI